MISLDKIHKLGKDTESAVDEVMSNAYSPDSVKRSPLFTAMKAAKLLGISRPSLNKILSDNPYIEVTPQTSKNGSPSAPKFTLEQIQFIRELLLGHSINEIQNVNIEEFKKNKNHMQLKIPRNLDETRPFIISIANLKGGSTKSTVTILLSQFLAMKGYKVLTIDSDPQHTTTDYLGFIPAEGHPYDYTEENTLLNLYQNKQPLRPLKSYWENIDVVPTEISGYNAEFILPVHQFQEEGNFFALLDYALNHKEEEWELSALTDSNCPAYNPDNYDIVLIDTPPSYSYSSVNALFASDALVVPVPPEMPDIAATGVFFNNLFEILSQFQKFTGDTKSYEFISTIGTKMSQKESNRESFKLIRDIYGSNCIATPLFESKAIEVASKNMQSLYELQSYNNVNRNTVNSAMQNVDEVFDEVESLVLEAIDKQKNLELEA